MIAPHQATCTTSELAAELRLRVDSTCRLAKRLPELRRAKITRGLFSVQRLRDAGFLPHPMPAAAPAAE